MWSSVSMYVSWFIIRYLVFVGRGVRSVGLVIAVGSRPASREGEEWHSGGRCGEYSSPAPRVVHDARVIVPWGVAVFLMGLAVS